MNFACPGLEHRVKFCSLSNALERSWRGYCVSIVASLKSLIRDLRSFLSPFKRKLQVLVYILDDAKCKDDRANNQVASWLILPRSLPTECGPMDPRMREDECGRLRLFSLGGSPLRQHVTDWSRPRGIFGRDCTLPRGANVISTKKVGLIQMSRPTSMCCSWDPR